MKVKMICHSEQERQGNCFLGEAQGVAGREPFNIWINGKGKYDSISERHNFIRISLRKGTAVSFDKSMEDSLITLKSAEAYDPDGFHPYYHFHGFTGNQVAETTINFTI